MNSSPRNMPSSTKLQTGPCRLRTAYLALLLLSMILFLSSCSNGGSPQAAGDSGAAGGGSGSGTTPTNLTLSALTLGVNPLSAYGTTSVMISVLNNGVAYQTPTSVTFASPCATSGKATLSASATTVNGVATASYLDKACAGDDVVTASIATGLSASATLTVTPPSSGSIQFVSASPTTIALKGTGGAGRFETSRVTFKVLDTSGNPIGGKTVNFSLNTTVGGLGLSAASATSDATTGLVVTDVQAGTVGTSVRVTATTTGVSSTTLSTMSDQLTVQTGPPDQDSFSISATTLNIEGLNYDGTQTTITIRTADHFNNPVPDGTAIYFTTEGGSVTASCTTVGGACSATLTSQAPRPTDGRVTVLAYAVGEESFTDLDGDGLADLVPNNEMVDASAASTDMSEAWVDWNKNGTRQINEPFIDFNNNGAFDVADGKYNGTFCNETADPATPTRVSLPAGGVCSAQKSIHVREDITIVFSSSSPGLITIAPTNLGGSCLNTRTMTLTVLDVNGNPMPADTTIAVSSSGNIITTGTVAFTVSNTTGTGSGSTVFFPQITGNSTCVAGNTGTLEVTVTTPKGNKTITVFASSVN